MKLEALKKRLAKDRPMMTVSIRFPEDVIEDLKRVAPLLGFSGYQPLIRAYVGQGLRVDLERLENESLTALVEHLKKRGISDAVLQEALVSRQIERCPFESDLELVTVDAKWVQPRLVARVKFAQWTADGRLRAPVFVGLRPDVNPRDVVREVLQSPPSGESSTSAPAVDREVTLALEQLSGTQDKLVLELGEHRIPLTNLNKALWPATKERRPVTKRELLRYYIGIGSVLLPHLRDRPLTFTRYPDGVEGESFYQKHWDQKLPEFVETVRLFSSHTEGDGTYLMVNNLATLAYKVTSLLKEPQRLASLQANARRLGRPRAAFDVVEKALQFS